MVEAGAEVELEKAMDEAESGWPALRSVSWFRVAVMGRVVGFCQSRPDEVVTGSVVSGGCLGLGFGEERRGRERMGLLVRSTL